MKRLNKQFLFIALLFCSACTIDPVDIIDKKDNAPTNIPLDVMRVPDAIPKYEKRTRAGNPLKYEVLGKYYKVLAESKGYQERGIASWYGTKFHGRKTSNGEIYDMYAMTAAHKTLPIPSYVRVTNLRNQHSVVLRINDRGPFHENRIIDLSYTAAVKLDIQQAGTGFVEVVTLEPGLAETPEKQNTQTDQKQKITIVYLQVGAFNNQGNAKQLQQKLSSGQIRNSRILLSHSQGNEFYKVQVGPINTVHQADEINEKLVLLGVMDTQLIVEKN